MEKGYKLRIADGINAEEMRITIDEAMMHFPELKDIIIEFRYKKMNATMMATITTGSVFKCKRKRTYLVYYNHQGGKKIGIKLHDVPSEARVGILAHELVHIADYTQRSIFNLLGLAIAYLFPSSRRSYERKTDMGTIEHGFGKQLLAYTEFIDSSPLAPQAYRDYLKKFYLNSEEIKESISKF
ncbi:MAG: hypothetical protein V2A54_07890 [Bacteroidota bacterium]